MAPRNKAPVNLFGHSPVLAAVADEDQAHDEKTIPYNFWQSIFELYKKTEIA
jgi:hypothetical protein